MMKTDGQPSGPGFLKTFLPLVMLIALIPRTGHAQFVAELLEEVDRLEVSGPADVRGETMVVGLDVYSWNGDGWDLQTTLVYDAPSLEGSFVPRSIALSQKEDRIVMGDSTANLGAGSSSGAAVVFVRTQTGWEEEARLTASDAAASAAFGDSVDISGDTIIVGDVKGNAAYIFDHDETNGWTEAARITVSDLEVDDEFGASVAISGDYAIVGAPHHDRIRFLGGAAYAFARNQGGNGQWGLEQKLVPVGLELADSMGETVDIEGTTVVIGAHSAARVFDRDDEGFWVENGNGLRPGDAPDLHLIEMGQVAIHENADVIVVGNFQHGGQDGIAHVYTLQGGAWSELKKLTSLQVGDFFGWDVSISGDLIVVTAQLFASQPQFTFTSNFRNETLVHEVTGKRLYYPDADNSQAYPKESAAFRYKHLLFAPDESDASQRLRSRTEDIGTLFGDEERDRAAFVKSILLRALQELPDSVFYQELLLDFYYDLTVAESLFAKEALEKAERARFGPPISDPPSSPGGFYIDNEIALYEDAIAVYRRVLEDYIGLLTDDFGIVSETPMGYTIFHTRVPSRPLMAATYEDSNGDHIPVVPNSLLFAGYKDLVLMFDLMRDYGQAVAEMARLLVARDSPGDKEDAAQWVEDAWRLEFIQGQVLENVFESLPGDGDSSGLQAAIKGWRVAMTQLTDIQQIIASDSNLLGFAPDFLMLIENFEAEERYDSFNVFAERLDLIRPASILTMADTDLDSVRTSYGDYRGYQDEIQEQFDQSTISYEFRLFEIVGTLPGQPGYSEDPTTNPGSELDQQYRSIELARLRIERNSTEISNLYKEMQIERNRATSIQDVRIRYGEAQAELTEWLGHINAVQAQANAFAQALSPESLTTGLIVGVAVNAAIQGTGEELKGQIEAEKERVAALEQAAIEGVESEARVKTLMLSMNTLVIDSQEAALLLQQEAARMTALYREKRTIEARIAERNESLASRYFADPIHRLASLSDMVSANLSFEEAQKWLFFMSRALEYKWNTPFQNYAYDGRSYSSETIYKLRNADELVDFYTAMTLYDQEVNRGRQPETSWFSVREHHFGYMDGNDAGGNPLLYLDPATDELVPAIEAFRRHLRRNIRQTSNGEEIVLEFSTARQIPGENFFLGPTFDANHEHVLDGGAGAFLDKIDGLFIRLPGTHTSGRSDVPGTLSYGGTSFIRNFDVGTFDPERPDRLENEITAYSTRYWFFHAPSNSWRFTEAFSNPVTMTLSSGPFQPTTEEEIVVFRERSVATTGWKLTIQTRSGQTELLDIDELTDVELLFKHSAISRQ